jgi:hypothetical protein
MNFMFTTFFHAEASSSHRSIKLKIGLWALVICWSISITLQAQNNDSTEANKKFEIRGYIKDLQSLTFDKNFDNLVTGNLIHNRLTARWMPTQKITGGMEIRNRLYWGEEAKVFSAFPEMLRNPNEAFNLSASLLKTESLVLHSTIDRLWLEYHGAKWDARIGRQRINWGIGTIWNPNDIFNTYNFLDFDYEERPGRDAVKFVYRLGEMSNIELAAAAADRNDKTVAAIKYFINKWNYDFQFTAGVFQERITAGAGWSGSIKDAGFKGELQYFAPHNDTASHVNVTLESDYVFEKGWYLSMGFLFNSAGILLPVDDWATLNFQLSPQNLMPTQWNTLLTLGKEFTPLFSGNLSMIYSPGTNLAILLPGIKYNIATNFDFDFIWQSFFVEQFNEFEAISHRCFLRMKWNF